MISHSKNIKLIESYYIVGFLLFIDRKRVLILQNSFETQHHPLFEACEKTIEKYQFPTTSGVSLSFFFFQDHVQLSKYFQPSMLILESNRDPPSMCVNVGRSFE